MSIDILYLSCNRKRFTEMSFRYLLNNTNWGMVDRLVMYDDCSSDGTFKHLRGQVDVAKSMGIEVVFFFRMPFHSPVAIMNHYVRAGGAERFVKIDNDIVVPPGYLEELDGVMARHPEVELLGMEAGRLGLKEWPADGVRGWEEGTHIGGVGMMRRSAFESRPPMVATGRFGFTEWQHEHRPVRGWIKPDLLVSELARVPLRWTRRCSQRYVGHKWQRTWPEYDARWMAQYWEWWDEEDLG